MASYFRIKDNINKREFVLRAPAGSQLLFCEIEEIVGMKNTWYDIPYALEVDGWGELATIGETFEADDGEFIVEAISDEDYYKEGL